MPRFDDGKDEGALRTIGEVSAATGIKPHVLRYWEDQFPQLRPLKRAGGRRLYRPADVAMIERIAALVRRDGYTLKGARGAIVGGTRAAPVADAAPEPQAAAAARPDLGDGADAVMARLAAIRDRLARALAETA